MDSNRLEARILKLKIEETILENDSSVKVQLPRLSVSSGAPDELLFEPLWDWISEIMKAYRIPAEKSERIPPESIRYSKAYYIRRIK